MTVSSLTVEQLEQAANKLRAIAHPMRISIINHLSDGKRLKVSEIHNLLEIDQSAASHHLRMLKDKGILNSKREGKNIFYFLKNKNISSIVDCMKKCSE